MDVWRVASTVALLLLIAVGSERSFSAQWMPDPDDIEVPDPDQNAPPADFVTSWLPSPMLVGGSTALVVCMVLSFVFPTPTPVQLFALRLPMALSAAAVGTDLVGSISVTLSLENSAIAAGGGFALFVIVYFWNPATLGPKAIGATEAETGETGGSKTAGAGISDA